VAFFKTTTAPDGLFGPLVGTGCGIALLALPDAYPLGLPLLLICLLGLAGFAIRLGGVAVFRHLPWLLLGYLYGHWQIGEALTDRLPLCADAVVRDFQLRILDEPLLAEMSGTPGRSVARFQGQVEVTDGDDCLQPGTYRVRLTWYDPPPLSMGELWQVEGRLRPPWGNLNPGGFDYERWLLGQGLDGTGYVRRGQRLQATTSAPGARATIRAGLRRWLESRETAYPGIMLALMSGDDSALTRTDWRLLRDSGTVHLLVVSGLHVGMVSGALFLFGRLLARLSTRLLLRFGARPLAGLFALSGAGAYVWLSGAGVPAVRAWLMSALVLLAVSSGRKVLGSSVVLLVMALLLIANPLVVHQQGFWLSFAAVLALVAWFEPLQIGQVLGHGDDGIVAERSAGGRRRGVLRRWIQPLLVFAQVQIVLTLALSPLLAVFQGGVPVQSPFVNALVVPLVSFIVLPLLLLAALLHFPLPMLADPLLNVAEATLELVMLTIATAARIPVLAMAVDGVLQWSLLLLTLLCLWRRPTWLPLCLSFALWWALLFPDGSMPAPNEFRLTALDVGQGSAILVDTHGHRLIFDAGPRYGSGFDLGDAVVVPSFQRQGSAALDALVLSHDDLDHTGGAASVIAQLAPARVWASFPFEGPVAAQGSVGVPAERCRAGVSWRWDGVTFRFLNPEPDARGSDNDLSCVLLVTNGSRAALLGGDISRRVERRLPKQPVDLLMAPHHGSKTSSSRSFVRGFSPRVVFISTDRRSRYGHPHPEVIARYAEAGIGITGRSGALSWRSEAPASAYAHRPHAAYWHRSVPVRP
jgi:competence protein ComEC